MLVHAFREGGWGMYPTLFFGLITLGTALRFAFRGDVRLQGFIDSMTKLVFFSGLTGFVTGMIMTGTYFDTHEVPGADFIPILVSGTKESTHNLSLAFTLLSLIHLVVAVGRRRVDARKSLAAQATSASGG